MIYLISPIVFTILLSISNVLRKKLDIKDKLFNYFILTLVFPIIYLINAYLFIFNLDTKYFSYLLIISFFISFFLLYEKNIYYLKQIFSLKKKFIYLFFLSIFIVTQFPAFEEDSLRYHLPIAKKIINQTFYENTWFDYLALSAHEFINVFYLNLGIETGSSLINFFYLVVIYILTKSLRTKNGLTKESVKGNDNDSYFILILLSSPYLVSLLSSQKLYILPCFISVFTIVYLYLNLKNIKFCQILLLSILSTFNIIIKITFLPYTILFFAICIFAIKNKIIELILYNLFFFIIFYFPLSYIKFKVYNDPFIPLISLNNENFWLNDYLYWLTSFNMDFTDRFSSIFVKMLFVPLKIIFPLTLSDIFKTLGVGVLYFLTFDIRNKKTFLLGFLFFASPLIFLNFQTRWFLPFLIFIMIFSNLNKFTLLKFFLKCQSFIVLSIFFSLSLITLVSKINSDFNDRVINKFSNTYKLINELNINYPNNKIYTSVNSFYYFNNFVPIYFPKITLKFDEDYFINTYKKNDLVLWEQRSQNPRIIETYQEFISKAFNCDDFKVIKDYYFNDRRFYILGSMQKVNLIRLNCSISNKKEKISKK